RTETIENRAGDSGTGDRFEASIPEHEDCSARDYRIRGHGANDCRHDALERLGPDDHFEEAYVCVASRGGTHQGCGLRAIETRRRIDHFAALRAKRSIS